MRFIVLCLLAVLPVVAFGMDVGACGVVVPRREVGELRADLLCGGDGLMLGSGATLHLNGFTIVGSGRGTGVLCGGRGCTIIGPGAIVGFTAGISAPRRVRISDIAIRSNDVGMTTKGGNVELSGIVATGNGVAIEVVAGRLRARDLEVSRNRDAGISTNASPAKLTSLVAVENGGLGGVYATAARGARVTIKDSTILGNDGLAEGYDIVTTGRAKLVNTICGRGARVRESRTSPETRTVIGRLGCRDD